MEGLGDGGSAPRFFKAWDGAVTGVLPLHFFSYIFKQSWLFLVNDLK